MKLKTKQLIYTSESIVIESDIALDTGISLGNFSLERYDDNVYTNIVLTSVSISGVFCTITTPVLQHNTIYVLTAFGIKDSTLTDTISAQIFRFLSVDKPAIYNTNNVYTKLNSIDKILNTEYLLKNQEDYTIQFSPSEYNYITKQYDKTDEIVAIENNKKILDLMINQYFTEYKPFYDAINNRTSKIIYEDDYINNLHLIFMNNIAKWYSLKGNQSFIEIMLNLYAKYLGYNVLSVIEDPQQNFVYRVSSSVPQIEWNKHIKPLVHPMGWKDIYNEVTSFIDGFYFQQVDLKRRIRETWALDCVSYLDAEAYAYQSVPHYRRIKNLYHIAGNIESYNVIGHQQNLPNKCSFQNVSDEYKFNINLNTHTTGLDLTNTNGASDLNTQLKDLKNISFFIDRFNKQITADFRFTGVANEYIYKHFKGNELVDIHQSLQSKVTIPFDSYDVLLLNLKRNEWNEDVYRIDELAFLDKSVPVAYGYNIYKNKYIQLRNSNKQASQYNGLAVGNFSSEHNVNNTLSYTKDYQYTFAISASTVSASFKSEFDTSSSFSVSASTFSINGNSFKNERIKYKKHGMSKYHWKLYTNGKLVQETDTYINSVNFNVLATDVASSNVVLTIYYKNGSYTLNNHAVCI